MIQFTRWTIILVISYLIVYALFEIYHPEDLIGYILIQIIDVLILVPIWVFVNWNIHSDEDLGIKPGIELF